MGPHNAGEANRVWHYFTCLALRHVASDYTVDPNRHCSQPVAYSPYTHVGPDTSDFNTGCCVFTAEKIVEDWNAVICCPGVPRGGEQVLVIFLDPDVGRICLSLHT
jgi:hypothetical protein